MYRTHRWRNAYASVASQCKNGEISHIGTYKGFELLVEKNFIGMNNMVL